MTAATPGRSALQGGAPAMVLPARPPFDFTLALAYLARSPLEPLDVVSEGRYRRALRLDGHTALIELSASGRVDRPALALRLVHPARAAGPLLERAADLVAHCLRLDQDLAGLAAVAEADPVFGAVLERMRGARALLMASPFEALIWAILGQQINIGFAYKLKRALVQRYGDAVEWEGRRYYLFPEAARLASLSAGELREIQFSRQKADYVIALATLEAERRIDWKRLRASPTEEAIAELTRLRGVGRWTAEYVCMRGLGHPDVIPAADLGLRAVIGRAYGLGRAATEAEVRTLAERWAGWRSHAAFCWWHTLSRPFPVER